VEEARADSTRAISMAGAHATAFLQIATVHERRPRVTETRLYLETIETSLAEPHKYIHAAQTSRGDVDLWIGTGGASPPELVLPEP
jgi:hypothetical protein